MRPVALLLMGILLAAPGTARAEQFRYKFRPGQVTRTRSTLAGASLMGAGAQAQTMKMQFRVTMDQVQRVRSVGGGVANVEMTETPVSGSITSMGKTEPYGKRRSVSVYRVTERGKLLSHKSAGGEAAGAEDMGMPSPMDAADALYGLNFPSRDLKPGDIWHDTVNVGAAGAARTVRFTGKFVGRELFRGRSCCKFESTISMPMGEDAAAPAKGEIPEPQGSVTGRVTTYFDPAAGQEVYSSGSLVLLMKADLSGISPEAGELVSVSKINFVQSLTSPGGRRK